MTFVLWISATSPANVRERLMPSLISVPTRGSAERMRRVSAASSEAATSADVGARTAGAVFELGGAGSPGEPAMAPASVSDRNNNIGPPDLSDLSALIRFGACRLASTPVDPNA